MRAAVFHGRRDLRLESVPEPVAGPGDVKLRVLYNGICGSDLLEYYDGPVTTRTTPHPLTGVKNPVILGHELCGEVVSVGGGVDDGLAPGDRVAVEPIETCGSCVWCGAGQYNHCPNAALHGYNRGGGGLAEFTVVRRSMAHGLPRSMTPMQGALIEPLAVAWHTANRCRLQAGQTVAIHGAGPIGIGVFLTLKARGVDAIVVDPSPLRRAVVSRLGARVTLDPGDCDPVAAIRDLTQGRGAHASVDAAGVPGRVSGGAAWYACRWHRRRGRHPPRARGHPAFRLADARSLSTGVAMSAHAFPSVIDAMARGDYPLEGWVETIALENLIEDGIERLHRQQGLKILVNLSI